MTRALIADPDLPAQGTRRTRAEIARCIGCQACIAHYHAGEAIRCAINPRTGRERSWPRRPCAATTRAGSSSWAQGRPGLPRPREAAAAGHEVVVLERTDRVGGQLALAHRVAPAAAAIAAGSLANQSAHARGRRPPPRHRGTVEAVTGLAPDARRRRHRRLPYDAEARRSTGVPVVQAWDALREPGRVAGDVVVADWGGDPARSRRAETLAGRGRTVTLCVASVAVGESLHQYRRNLALQRLYRAGVESGSTSSSPGADAGGVVFSATSSLRSSRSCSPPTRSSSRSVACRPTSSRPHSVAAGLRVEEAGDCLSPRSLEEAVLEGTGAAQRAFA